MRAGATEGKIATPWHAAESDPFAPPARRLPKRDVNSLLLGCVGPRLEVQVAAPDGQVEAQNGAGASGANKAENTSAGGRTPAVPAGARPCAPPLHAARPQPKTPPSRQHFPPRPGPGPP